MKLSEILEVDNIIPDLKARDKKEALEELAEAVVSNKPALDKPSLVKILLERERLGSTGIGDGVAIPHGKFGGIDQPIVSFGRSLKGLDFESMDGQPAYLFFLLLAPENSANIHLKVLARIAKILKKQLSSQIAHGGRFRKEIYETIIQDDEEI